MSAARLMTDLARLGIRIKADGERLRFSPRSTMTPGLIERLQAHKGELLAMVSDRPVTDDERRNALDRLASRLNAGYQGGPIDWGWLDSLERRIKAAVTMADLTSAIAAYEVAALH